MLFKFNRRLEKAEERIAELEYSTLSLFGSLLNIMDINYNVLDMLADSLENNVETQPLETEAEPELISNAAPAIAENNADKKADAEISI